MEEHGRNASRLYSRYLAFFHRFARADAREAVRFGSISGAVLLAGLLERIGGEGHTAFTIAGPTGEGMTSARTFTRQRRCTLVEGFRQDHCAHSSRKRILAG